MTPVKIAMWSGPRNMSTTLMRSFSARGDTLCVDEPFYAAYLKATGLIHPMQDAVMASQSTDPHAVAAQMLQAPEGVVAVYQKHMTHHMVAAIPRAWMGQVRNAFLIRHPARVLASYARKMESVSLEATGFPQQLDLFETACTLEGRTPPVVDSDAILRDPAASLSRLCTAIGLDWTPAMLNWPQGPRPEDGAWAPHWYDAVWSSSGFGPAPGPLPTLTGPLAELCDAAMPIYETLSAHALT